MKGILLLSALLISLVQSCTYEPGYIASDTTITTQNITIFDIQPEHYLNLPVEYLNWVNEIDTEYEPCVGTFDTHAAPPQICFYCNSSAEVGTSHVMNLYGEWPAQQFSIPFRFQFIYNIVE